MRKNDENKKDEKTLNVPGPMSKMAALLQDGSRKKKRNESLKNYGFVLIKYIINWY